jgi:L-Ala-D/L-Glu epimerase
MKLTRLNWYPYKIPFRDTFLTAHGTLTHRAGALVAVETDAGITGYGEIAPLPEFSGTSLADALRLLPELGRELEGKMLVALLNWLESQNQDAQLPAPLLSGLETALLDAAGQDRGESIATLLACNYPYEHAEQAAGILPTSIPVNAVISGATTAVAVDRACAAIAAGFTCLKLKITEASQEMIERVATIRAAIGSEPHLRLDANEAWNLKQAQLMLDQCSPYAIEYVEQPLPARDLDGMASLRHTSRIPLAADEALSNLASVRRMLQAEAADILILKPQLSGGLYASRQIIQEASRRGIACVITSTLEAGIGVAAALHLAAASPEITLACGLATLDLLADDLLQDGLYISQGRIAVPTGPGLGVRLDLAALQRYS